MRDRLRAIAGAGPGDSAHDLGHLDRVWANAQHIAEGTDRDRTVLMAAAYLHDIVALPKDHPDRAQASRRSAQAARPHLAALGLTPAQIAATCHAIAAHSFSAGIRPETDEARILQDADRIDALGAVGLARCFAVSGALGRPLFHPDDPFAEHRAPDDSRFALDHFQTKLLRLPATMQTERGRALAEVRAGLLLRYLADLKAELPSSSG